MAREKAEQINRYLAISGDASDIDSQLKVISGGDRFAGARNTMSAVSSRWRSLVSTRRFHFAAGFGRELEYYTGFTFQVEADTPDGAVAVAGGGRYDNLLSDMGSPVRVPAVGCAIHTDRLMAVLA